MISVAQALELVCGLARPLPTETVPLVQANGRVLAEPAHATRNQPPFAGSAMDGYAVRDADIHPGATLTVIGESAAGHSFGGTVSTGKAVRIFTGAPVPKGADRIVIQEDVTRKGDTITIGESLGNKSHIRPAGDDFREGDTLTAPRRLGPGDLSLLASMNIPTVTVARRPDIAILATGDELVMPGEAPSADQIIASNGFGLKALLEDAGATVRLLPIARDTKASLRACFELATGADLLVTIGGASVGDHDLVGDVAAELGMDRAFYKVAMRPGKPLMAGRLGDMAMVGLPGNPVSSLVCGHVFLKPMIRKYLCHTNIYGTQLKSRLAHEADPNGPREHYMRGRVDTDGLTIFPRQDSALMTVYNDANALIIRPPNDPARKAGEMLSYIPI